MTPTTAVVTAKIPTELRDKLDALTTEGYTRNAAIGDAIAQFVQSGDGLRTGLDKELRALLDEHEATIAGLRAELTNRPAARSTDADHVAPPVPTKKRKQLWESLHSFQSRKIGGMTAAEVLGDLEQRFGRRLPQNGIAKRVSELHQGGYITDDPRKAADPDGAWATAKDDRHTPATKGGQPSGAYTRLTPFGKSATVYWVTKAGVDHFENPPKA